jgi:hypothetical protein
LLNYPNFENKNHSQEKKIPLDIDIRITDPKIETENNE